MTLRFLLVEDDPSDAELTQVRLERHFRGAEVTLVDTEAAYRHALTGSPDAVLCDYNVPGFGALRALAIQAVQDDYVPLIVLTGAVGEEAAAECIKLGASDFLLKDNADRLPRAIEKAVHEARLRKSLAEAEQRYQLLVETVPAVVYKAEAGPAGRWFYLSPQVEALLGVPARDIMGSTQLWEQLVHPSDREGVTAAESVAIATGAPLKLEYRMIKSDGSTIWVHDEAIVVSGDPSYFHGFLTDVTEKHLAVEALRTTEAHYRGLVESVNAIMWRSDPKAGLVTYVSREAESLLGYPIEAWTTQRGFWEAHLHPDDVERVTTVARQAVEERQPYRSEYRFIAADGRVLWLRDMVKLKVENDEVVEVFGVITDITQLKEAERAARTRATQQSAVADLGLAAMDATDVTDLMGLAVRSVTKTLGVECCLLTEVREGGHATVLATAGYGADVLGSALPLGTGSPEGYALLAEGPLVSRNVHEDSRFTFLPLTGEENVVSGMSVLIRKDEGNYGVLSAYSSRSDGFTDNDVNFLQSVANVLSSAIRRQYSHQAITFQGRLLDEVGAAVYGLNTDGTINYWNKGAETLLGWRRDEVLGANALDILVLPEDLDRASALFRSVAIGGHLDIEWTVRAKDGHSVPLQISVSSHPSEAGKDSRITVVGVDVTDRQEMQERLTHSEEQFRTAFMNMSIGMMICDHAGRYVAVNDCFCEMLGYGRDDLLRLGYQDVTHPDDVGANEEDFTKLVQHGGVSKRVKRYVRKDGGIVWAEVTDTVLGRPDGSGFQALVHVADITQKKKAEEDKERLEKQLVQSQKMEAIGRLAGGIAHDFNNLLSVIINYAAFVDEDLADDAPGKADLKQIRVAGQKATELVRQLLTFARREPSSRATTELNEAVSGVRGLMERSIGEDIDLVLELDDHPYRVGADVTHLEQILMNLVVNARDALPRGGRIVVRTGLAEIRERDGVGDLQPGEYLSLRVSDDGEGISPELIDHIFEPFFSTKPRDQGTGLGLATVYGLAHQHGGSIRVESEIGVGTTFEVLFPALEPVTEESGAEVPGDIEKPDAIAV